MDSIAKVMKSVFIRNGNSCTQSVSALELLDKRWYKGEVEREASLREHFLKWRVPHDRAVRNRSLPCRMVNAVTNVLLAVRKRFVPAK